MITIFSTDPLYFLSRLKGRFENSRSQTSDLNPIKSENTAFIKKFPNLLSSVINAAFSSALVRWCFTSY